MNNDEFERFVLKFGKDILRFCRMTAGDAENGDELYQDTMLKLLEKKKRLDSMQNTKSYALSTSIYLWKNRKKKYANRMRLVPIDSMDEMSDEGYEFSDHDSDASPEHIVLRQNEADMIQQVVKTLPEKYRIPIYLYYSDREIRLHRKGKDKIKKFGKIGTCAAAAVAAAVIGIGGLGYFNPVLAAKIPLIGKIFEKVEDDARYSGDYTDKKTVLTNEDPAGNLDTSDYTVSDQGITLTASEAYCDGYSIFLTVNIVSKDADFTHIPEHYTSMKAADGRTAAGFYIDGRWSVDGSAPEWIENTFDGEVIDSHTFAGMLKIDLTEKHAGSGELNLNVTGLGYDDDRMLDSEQISASHWTDGSWNITVPFEVNGTDVKTIEVSEKAGNITLEDVVVSPYQVIVHTTTPGKQRELTDDRREKLLSEDPDITDAEMFELLGWSYEPCYTICFDQDGEMLYADTEIAGRAGFAVQGKTINTLYVFIFDNFDDWIQMEQEGMSSSAADRAVIAREIQVA